MGASVGPSQGPRSTRTARRPRRWARPLNRFLTRRCHSPPDVRAKHRGGGKPNRNATGLGPGRGPGGPAGPACGPSGAGPAPSVRFARRPFRRRCACVRRVHGYGGSRISSRGGGCGGGPGGYRPCQGCLGLPANGLPALDRRATGLDSAPFFRLALEKGHRLIAAATRVADEGVAIRAIAEVIRAALRRPRVVCRPAAPGQRHFLLPLAGFLAARQPVSSNADPPRPAGLAPHKSRASIEDLDKPTTFHVRPA